MGVVLAGVGAGLFVAYPLLISAVDVGEFQDQSHPGKNGSGTFKDYDNGDDVYIKDEISGVHFDSAAKLTVVRIDEMEFHFKGKVYDDFAKGDMVIIKDKVIMEKNRQGNKSHEALQGTVDSLDEENIQFQYGSTTEMAFLAIAIVGLMVIIAGVFLNFREPEEEEEEFEPYELAPTQPGMPGTPGMAGTPGMPGTQGYPGTQPGMSGMAPQPGMAPGMAPAAMPAAPVTVACPTCQQHLMIADPTRPITVACPHCANPLMIQ